MGLEEENPGVHGDDAGEQSQQEEQPGEPGRALATVLVGHVVILERGTADQGEARIGCLYHVAGVSVVLAGPDGGFPRGVELVDLRVHGVDRGVALHHVGQGFTVVTVGA